MSKNTIFDVAIIGSGPAGGVAAQTAASERKKVALIEVDKPGGDTVHYGEVPLYALSTAASSYQLAKNTSRYGIRAPSVAYNYVSINKFKDSVIREATGNEANPYSSKFITYFGGKAVFTDKKTLSINGEKLKAHKYLIATGSSNVIPNIPGLEDTGFITYKQAGQLSTPPKSIIVIGAGREGVEYATLFANFGTKVTIVEKEDRLLPKEDSDIGSLLANILTGQGIDVRVACEAISADTSTRNKKTIGLKHELGEEHVTADEIFLATGKIPNIDLNLEAAKIKFDETGITVNNQLRTTNKIVFAAGDVTGFSPYAHMAIHQGHVAIHNIIQKNKENVSFGAVPRVYSTTPEIACLGYSENELKKTKKQGYKSVKLPISVATSSLISKDEIGFVKIIASPEGQILGASIVGPRAWDTIQEIAVAMQYHLSVNDIAKTMHAFGSWSDAVRATAAQF